MKLFDITDKAKTKMEGLLSKNPDKYAVSLSVLGGGCAGFKYDWGFTNKDAISKDDILEDWGTGRFVVHESSLLYVTGTQIDYKEEVSVAQFEISNPNSKSSCGCGDSFAV